MVSVAALRARAAEKRTATTENAREQSSSAVNTCARGQSSSAVDVMGHSTPRELPSAAPSPAMNAADATVPRSLAAVTVVPRPAAIGRVERQRSTGIRTFMPLAPAAARGTMALLRAEAAHLSPAIGLALSAGGSTLPSRLYDVRPATWPPTGDGSAIVGSVCGTLTRQLFHRNHIDEPLRPTMNLSLVAAHLSASMAAHVVGLAWRRPDLDSLRDALSCAVCNEAGLTIPERVRGTVPTVSRFVSFTQMLMAADDDSSAPLRHTGTALVLYHLWLRSSTRAELWTYLSTLETFYGPVLASPFTTGGRKLDSEAALAAALATWNAQRPFSCDDLTGSSALEAARQLFAVDSAVDLQAMTACTTAPRPAASCFEVVAAALAAGSSRTAPVMMGHYAYRGQSAKADCSELVMTSPCSPACMHRIAELMGNERLAGSSLPTTACMRATGRAGAAQCTPLGPRRQPLRAEQAAVPCPCLTARFLRHQRTGRSAGPRTFASFTLPVHRSYRDLLSSLTRPMFLPRLLLTSSYQADGLNKADAAYRPTVRQQRAECRLEGETLVGEVAAASEAFFEMCCGLDGVRYLSGSPVHVLSRTLMNPHGLS